MADEIAAVADSAPAADAATGDTSGQAVEQPSATHGDGAGEATSSDRGAPEGAAPDGDDPDHDPETEPSENDTPEEAKTKAQKRRERRQAADAKRIADAVQAELTREREAAAEKARAEKAQADAEAAQAKWREKFGAFVGTPDERKALAQEIDALISTTVSVNLDTATQDEYDRLTAAQKSLAEKKAKLATLDANASVYQQLDEFQFQNTQAAFAARAAVIPESHRGAYLSATTVEQALERLEAGVRADEQAKARAERARVEAEWKGKYEKEAADHAATRNGAPGAGPAPNGANGSGTVNTYTRERLRQMMQTPEGLAEYRRNRTEIERQEAAGLIR